MTKDELISVRNWANEKISSGDEPPWAWYQYMKLREALDAITRGMEATQPAARLQIVGPDFQAKSEAPTDNDFDLPM